MGHKEVEHYYKEQIYDVVWEREKQKGSSPVERSRSEEVKTVRSWLRCEVYLPARVMVMSGPGLLLSVLIFLSPVTVKGQKDKVLHRWPRPSLATALGRIDLAPPHLQYSGEQTLLLAWAEKFS